MDELKETTQARMFDECVAELSPSAQLWFGEAVRNLASAMGRGAGEKSAKALLFAIALDGNYKGTRQ